MLAHYFSQHVKKDTMKVRLEGKESFIDLSLENEKTKHDYKILGVSICLNLFSSVLGLNRKTVQAQVKHIYSTENLDMYTTKRNNSHLGHFSAQTAVVTAFLQRYGEVNGQPCPTGRGSTESTCVVRLESCNTKKNVYEKYTEEWSNMINHAMNHVQHTQTCPEAPASYKTFCKIWLQHLPYLRIAPRGTDFCDTCTIMREKIDHEADEIFKNILISAYEQHRSEAKIEFENYLSIQNEARKNTEETYLHLVFDFAEKRLLPCLTKQPGQLHFITGLKLDLFGISNSNESQSYIYILPEGHWPNQKTANEVLSMLHHSISEHKKKYVRKSLKLSADNCAGQNKNRFVLFYLASRIIAGFEDSITLCFLVAGHTKNVCDGAFGTIKNALKHIDAIKLKQMTALVENSAYSTSAISANQVKWQQWKKLAEFLIIPKTLRITQYHVFHFCRDDIGSVHAKKHSTDDTFIKFKLFKGESLSQSIQNDI